MIVNLLRKFGTPALALAALSACTYDTPLAPTPSDAPAYDLLFESTKPTIDGVGVSQLRLMVYHTDSGTIAPLFGQDIAGGSPTVSADGQRVIYVGAAPEFSDYDYQDLWVVSRGTAPTRLMLPSGPEHDPAISPDAQRVAYAKPDASFAFMHLYLVELGARVETPLAVATAPGMNVTYAGPAWSPDGTRLLFSAGAPGMLHLYVMRADGSQLRQITDAPYSDFDATWSPDGETIAFVRTMSATQQVLMTRHLITGAERTFHYPHRARHPAWSPDGSQIAFVSNMSDNAAPELYTVHPDGSALTRLTNDTLRQQRPRWIRR